MEQCVLLIFANQTEISKAYEAYEAYGTSDVACRRSIVALSSTTRSAGEQHESVLLKLSLLSSLKKCIKTNCLNLRGALCSGEFCRRFFTFLSQAAWYLFCCESTALERLPPMLP